MGCGGSKKAKENQNVAAPESKPLKDDIKEGEGSPPAVFEFKVALERKADEPSGVEFEFPSCTLSKYGTDALKILLVNPEGLLPSWNAANPEKQVKEGDLIVEVNGVTNNTDKMLEHFAEKVVTLLIQRAVSIEKTEPVVEPAAEPAVEPAVESPENVEEPQTEDPETKETAVEPAMEPAVELPAGEPAEDANAAVPGEDAQVVTGVSDCDGIVPVELDEAESGKDAEKKVCVFC